MIKKHCSCSNCCASFSNIWLLSQIYAFSSVKFLGLELRLCKRNDKYQVFVNHWKSKTFVWAARRWLLRRLAATNWRLHNGHFWGRESWCCHLVVLCFSTLKSILKHSLCQCYLCLTREFLCLNLVPHSGQEYAFSVLCTFICTW